MKFFQKRGVAITITLILIVAALLIGKPWASSNTATASAANSDYLSYIADDANALTNDARSKVADYMETLDSKYGSIVALMTITDTDGETMEDYAKSVWDEAEFLDSDMLLVVNTETGEWYLQPGSEIAPYADASLESLFTNDLDNANLADGGKWATDLYKDLLSWYGKTIPKASSTAAADTEYVRQPAPQRRSLWKTILIILIVFWVLKAIFGRSRRNDDDDDYRGGSSGGSGGGFWKGMFWGSLLGGSRRNRWRTPPPPRGRDPARDPAARGPAALAAVPAAASPAAAGRLRRRLPRGLWRRIERRLWRRLPRGLRRPEVNGETLKLRHHARPAGAGLPAIRSGGDAPPRPAAA